MSKRRRNREKKKTFKPFCYYCDREFDDLRILIEHQKAKHFKCSHCPRRLVSVSGMITHVTTVHKMQVTGVPNAKEDRDHLDFDVVGMEGIPHEFLEEKYGGEIPEEIEHLLPSHAQKKARLDSPSAQQQQQQHHHFQSHLQTPHQQPYPPQMGLLPHPMMPHQTPPYGAVPPFGMMPPHPHMPPFMGTPPPPPVPPGPFGMPPFPPYGAHPPPPPFGMPPAPAGVIPPPVPHPTQLQQTQAAIVAPAAPAAEVATTETTTPVAPSTPSKTITTTPSVPDEKQENETTTTATTTPTSTPTTAPTTPSTAATPVDDQGVVMIYPDQDMSMEERRSSLSKYSFVHQKQAQEQQKQAQDNGFKEEEEEMDPTQVESNASEPGQIAVSSVSDTTA